MISKKKKFKLNSTLLRVIIISAGLHIVALVIMGGITIVRYVIPDEAQFDEPPVTTEVEPPKEVKVQISQKPPSQDQAMKGLRMKPISNIAVSAIDVDLPDMNDAFTVSAGIGGVGGGSLLGSSRGSLGIGMSNVSIFGLKTRAERILFVIDANRQMVTDAKGGLNSYQVIKDEITDMVGNLSTGTLFNIMLVDRRSNKLFKSNLVPAGQEVHQELVSWIAPINTDASRPGLEGAQGANRGDMIALSDHPMHRNIKQSGQRGNETAFITQIAIEQKVDAIFFISGYHRGFERIRRINTEEENAAWKKKTQDADYQAQLAAHNAEREAMQRRVAVELAKINKERAEKGQPPRVLSQRHGVHSNAGELGLKWQTEHPGRQPARWEEPEDLEKYFKELMKTLYQDGAIKEPSVNVVLFLAGDEEMRDEWEDSLKDFVRFFGGRHRVIRGLEQIRSARSSQTEKN